MDNTQTVEAPEAPVRQPQRGKKVGCMSWVFVSLFAIILIIILLPLLTKPNLYSCRSEDCQIIGEFRTMIELYHCEKGHLPGLQTDSEGHLVKNSPDHAYCVSICGKDDAHYIQTMDSRKRDFPGNQRCPAFMGISGGMELCGQKKEPRSEGHAFKQLNVSFQHVRGGGYRAHNEADLAKWIGSGVGIADRGTVYQVQHIVPYSDFEGKSYCYAVGIFDDDCGLHQGTGRAVLEFNHVDSKTKFVATYEKYKPQVIGCRLFFMRHPLAPDYYPQETFSEKVKAPCLFLLPQSGFIGVPSSGGVIIPSLDGIIHAAGRTGAENEIAKFKEALLRAGWDLQ